MNYPSIQIFGNILSPDLLNRLETDDNVPGQKPKDFKIESAVKVREEIAQAWSLANSYYKGYKMRLAKLSTGSSGESETRNLWISPLLSLIGYNLRYEKSAQILNGKTYNISDPAENLDDFPVIIAGSELDLDQKSYGLRMSPHALLQEYLNFSESHLYGLVTNGKLIRLLRDSGRIIRLSYLEIDLERMFDEGLYADFALFFRLLHASRMPKKQHTGPECLMEQYHLDALESGTRIRENLSKAVEEAILAFGNGFLQHPANQRLREAVTGNRLDSHEYYRLLLRLIYRLLFLMVIEERNLVYPQKPDEETRRLRDIFYRYYSLGRLRALTRNSYSKDNRFTDLWQSLVNTFRLFEEEQYGKPLGIRPLNGELFGSNALDWLTVSVLDNKTLLNGLEKLSWFTNRNGSTQPINYKLLNVEEFGSVYEGLLEYDPMITPVPGGFTFSFVEGTGRSSSGSHYTPEELVQPLIKHSLDYLLEDREKLVRKEVEQQKLRGADKANLREKVVAKHFLTLKVADVACGSGHILLSAARRIAMVYAALTEESDQPTPTGMRHATREVIRNCIYGVDKNPLAVELCKVALWLEAHNPGEPLSFLDHRIKCGDAIVGLAHRDELENGIADEAFKTLPGDDKDIATLFRNKNKKERLEREAKAVQTRAQFEKQTANSVQDALTEYRTFTRMPENTPEEIKAKQKAYRKFLDGKGYSFLKTMADTQVAQFFIPKTTANKDRLVSDAQYMAMLAGWEGWQGQKTSYARDLAAKKRFFHWFLEFPEVFAEGMKKKSDTEQGRSGGFDCILGNPPYLGGQRLTTNFGNYFFEWLKFNYTKTIGACDLITYFIRRIFLLIKNDAYLSIISTSTISQGDTRESGLEVLINHGATICFAVKAMRWPGIANVDVSLLSILKGNINKPVFLNNRVVKNISSFLDDEVSSISPITLLNNNSQSFIGSFVLGKGFVLEPKLVKSIFKIDKKYEKVILPYLNGDDLNSSPSQTPSRWVINFFNWNEEFCRVNYPVCFDILFKEIKPVREKDNRKSYRDYWWHFAEKRPKLYETIRDLHNVLIISRRSKHVVFSYIPKGIVYSEATVVIAPKLTFSFTLLSSNIHDIWSWKYGGTLGSVTIAYNPSAIYETFPFPININQKDEQKLFEIGIDYSNYRQQLMLKIQLGLTKTYNAFHSPNVNSGIAGTNFAALPKPEIEKKYGKEVWNLWNHLQRTPRTCSFAEALAGIEELRRLHVEMDSAVLEAYGWAVRGADGPAISLRHDFYEVDYLPENDRIRFTIHPDARKEVLKRLLQLNHLIFEQEAREGKHKEADVIRFYEQKGQPIPPEVSKWFGKGKPKAPKQTKSTKAKASEPAPGYGNLWDQPAPAVVKPPQAAAYSPDTTRVKNFKVIIRNRQGQQFKYHILPEAEKGFISMGFKQIKPTSPLAEQIIGKKVGDKFEFGGVEYWVEIIEI
ncbi:MAG: Eco57I restriction-modification methylase domain-containing protein [Bacteroidota bacterium]